MGYQLESLGKFAGKLGIDWSLKGKWSWCFMELVSPIMFGTCLIVTRPTWTPFQITLTCAWMIHYLNRSIIYPYRATSMAPIHVLAFVCGTFFNALNGYTNGMWVGRHSNSLTLQFCFGVTLWAVGFISNVYHDNLLFRLRLQNKDQKTKKYFIPYDGLFEYVSCPNYFSESVEWFGFAIATTYNSTPAIIFVASTIANLWPRAWRTHLWYKNQFEQYPNTRKAVIPFLL
jgi:3-oxo-5-alpha-steroid 4-dehydrogenase 1